MSEWTMLRQASAEVGAVVAAVVAIAAGSRRQLEAAPAAATLVSLLGIPS